jgi:hypothetical protein
LAVEEVLAAGAVVVEAAEDLAASAEAALVVEGPGETGKAGTGD